MSDYDLLARHFDLFSGQASDDLPVYTAFAQRTGGPILELGCGTGRIVQALAGEGYTVTGVDYSPAMLALAQRKVEQAGLQAQVELTQSDLRNLELKRHFKMAVCAQNTFCHMLTTADQLQMLRTANRHLEPGGLLVLDIFNPDPVVLAQNERKLVLMDMVTDPNTGHTFTQTMARQIDTSEQLEHVTLFIDELDGARLIERHVFEFDLRYVFRFELELLLDKTGFALEALYGSYDLEPFGCESERLLAVSHVIKT